VGVRTDWAHNQPLPMLLLQLQPHRNPVRVSLPCVDVLLQERKNKLELRANRMVHDARTEKALYFSIRTNTFKSEECGALPKPRET
jgi:hypothetical protein